MSNQNGRPSHSLLLISIFLCILTAPATARGQGPAAPPPSSQQTPESKNSADTKNNKKQGEKQKKSKLEQETGTTNDRIFEVMPNYGTVEGAEIIPRLSTGKKFKLATAGVFDYFTYPFAGRDWPGEQFPEIVGAGMGSLRETLRSLLRRQWHRDLHDDRYLPQHPP